MANTFPSSGNAGIGTTSPDTLLTIDTGGNTTAATARIRGRSPAWILGAASSPYTGGEAFVGLITTSPPDYVAGAGVGDAFFIHGSNANRISVGRTANNVPVMAIHNTSANVAVGLGVTVPTARIVAAGPIPVGTETHVGAVQLQGSSAVAATHTLSLGYGGSYNNNPMAESAYIQAEWQGNSYRPLRLQPNGGMVFVGEISGAAAPPDINHAGNEHRHRLHVIQGIDRVANVPAGNTNHVMAMFEMVSTIPEGNDISCGSFFLRQIGRSPANGGGSWFRAIEAQAIRWSTAGNARTWGIEVGVHNANRGEEVQHSVGIYMHSGNKQLLDVINQQTQEHAPARRCNTGILIDGRPGGEDGWDQFILCRKGALNETQPEMFKVDRFGNVTAAGTLYHTGFIQTAGDVIASGTVSAGAEMYATQFITYSSIASKENIVPLDSNDSMQFLSRLQPVRYNFKDKPDRRLIGFIVEDVPAELAVNTKGVDVMAVVATLAGVVRSQQDEISDLRSRVAAIEQRGITP